MSSTERLIHSSADCCSVEQRNPIQGTVILNLNSTRVAVVGSMPLCLQRVVGSIPPSLQTHLMLCKGGAFGTETVHYVDDCFGDLL